ncbi:MAG TPA: DUF4158 domain-containing protein, partial [Actinomycetota bacterium]|nr:DUF4158 domain-containing protein [Actinomycetota bacterium]
MAVDVPAEEQFDTAGYDRFSLGTPTRRELERYFFLDDADKMLIAKRRGDHNRLGFGLQVATVRYLGTFLSDPLDVPTEAVDYVASQLEIPDASCVKAYLERKQTRFEHQWEIAREYRWRDFGDVEDELIRWVGDRAWTTGEGPRTLFDASVGWLRHRKVLLPAASTLGRVVGRVREEAEQRLWTTLAGMPTPSQASHLEALLKVPKGPRSSDLDRLGKGPVTASGKSMLAALDRVAEIAAFGLGNIDLGAVPRRRVVELARYGMAGKATLLRRHPWARKLATLVATVVHLQAKATDDALELLDVLMTTDLLAHAHRVSREERLHRYPQVSRDAGRLAAAVRVLLKASESGTAMSLEALWEAIEAVVSRADLRAAVDNITRVVPGPDEDPDAEWRGSLVQRATGWCGGSCLSSATPSSSAPGRGDAHPGGPARPPRTRGVPANHQGAGRPSRRGAGGGGRRAARLAQGRVPSGEAGGDGASRRLRVLRAGAVPPAPSAPRHLRPGLLPVGRPTGAAAGRGGLGGGQGPGAECPPAP